MAVRRQGRAEARQSAEATALARSHRPGDGQSRRVEPGGPAFISDRAEEQYHLDQSNDARVDALSRSTARIEVARIYERRGEFGDAVEMYQRNIWAGARTPATFAGLAAAYRQLGRNDLGEATLEQIRREGGSRSARPQEGATTTLPSRAGQRRQPGGRSSQRRDGRKSSRSRPAEADTRIMGGPDYGQADAGGSSFVDLVRRYAAPILANEIARRALIASSVLLPIGIGVAVFAVVVMNTTRSRSADTTPVAETAPAPTAVLVIAPTAAPTSAIPPALAAPPAAAKLIVRNVGGDGLLLRRSPGIGERLNVWKDGTELADLGDSAEHSGKTWRKVRDPQGTVGWAAADFLGEATAASVPASGATNLSASAPPQRVAAAAPPFASGGLGLTRAEWEKAHGQPTRSSVFLEYAGGRLVVGLLEGNIMHVERVWSRGDAVTLDAAREDARAYLVSDAVLVQSVDRGDGRVIDVYNSPLLASRFGPTSWNGGRSGTFSIHYRFRSAADRMVTSAMFRLGDVLF